MKRIICFRATVICLLAIWMITIFSFSSQNADQSSAVSNVFVEKFISILYPKYNDLSLAYQTNIISVFTQIIRKSAHFFEYFILGVLSQLSVITFKKYKILLRAMISTGFCVLYAVSDEIHQYFVPGRACRIGDILIDSMGSILAITIILIVYKKINRGESNA